MLRHVWERVSQCQQVSNVWILTDNLEVEKQASSWGAQVIMTSEDCPSGTDRIASVIHMLEADVVVNVQGDEPLIEPKVVDQVVEAMRQGECDIATPVYPIRNIDDVLSPNVVKVVRGRNGRALYFSRSPIPHVRDSEPAEWLSKTQFWGHVGVYGYRRSLLEEYSLMPPGELEDAEKLEQLRFLEAGKQIVTVEVDYHPHAVDVPSDLELVKRLLDSSHQPS